MQAAGRGNVCLKTGSFQQLPLEQEWLGGNESQPTYCAFGVGLCRVSCLFFISGDSAKEKKKMRAASFPCLLQLLSSFIHSVHQDLLHTHYMPGTIHEVGHDQNRAEISAPEKIFQDKKKRGHVGMGINCH